MLTRIEKTRAFHALHERSDTFVIPNPWGLGSARLPTSMGFETLISTSTDFAFSCGLPDYDVGHDTILAHAADSAAATDVPMTTDLENSFDDAPETVAETIRLAGATGIVGGSIEDTTGRIDTSIYSLEAPVDHVRAAVGAACTLPFSFALTVYPENHLYGRSDPAGTIRRLQIFPDAGADVLYAPGLRTHDEIAAALHEIDRPLDVLIGFANDNLDVAELIELGVKRIGVGTTLARVTIDAFMRTAGELHTAGTFSFARDAASETKLNGLFAPFA